MEYGCCFEIKIDEIVFTESIKAISSLSDHPDLSSSIFYNIPEVKSPLSKNKKTKKTRKKTTTKKLLKEVAEKVKISGDLE